MAVRRKTFSTYKQQSTDPVEIVLNENVFHFKGTMSGIEILDYFSRLDADNIASAVITIRELLDKTILPEEKEAFEAYLKDPDNGVDVEVLSDIAAYLLESYSNHPTQSSGASSSGSSTNGLGSTEKPFEQGATSDF